MHHSSEPKVRAQRPWRKVVKAQLVQGQSFVRNYRSNTCTWYLELECGHTVLRPARYKKLTGAERGWGAVHRGRSPKDILPAPTRVRCEVCKKEEV